MPGVKFIEHGGERILLMDFSNAGDGQGIVETAEKAMRLVRSTNQKHSVRGLMDLSGTPLDKVVRGTMKRMSRSNGPYMKSVAFVGFGAVLASLFKGLLYLTGRSNHRVFKAKKDALDWLARN